MNAAAQIPLLKVDQERLWADVMALGEISDPTLPYTRRSFTPLFLQGREFIAERFREAGLSVRLDSAGNLIGRREGKDPQRGVLMIGSHSDSVPNGGRFDGIAGVLAGLEAARALRDGKVELAHSLEIVDFLAEEPSVFGLSCIGSRGMSDCLEPAMLQMTAPGGNTLAEAMRYIGANPEALDAARRDDIRAFFELHIEQGAVLETAEKDIGIVSGIVGITRIEIEFSGEADHAGTTPIHLRRDALVPAASTVTRVRELAEEIARTCEPYFIATVGMIDVSPGASNVVPRRATIVIDARTSDRALLERFLAAVDEGSASAAAKSRVERARFEVLSDSMPVDCDPALQELLRAAAGRRGFSHQTLPSGAGHDAAFMTRLAPTAMVFIPCRRGKSHSPREWTEPSQLANGTAVMLDALLAADARVRP